jgi:cytochrome P450
VDTAAVPHPPYRIPLVGDFIGFNPRTPLQSMQRRLQTLGPIAVQKWAGIELVTVTGVELVTELNDESRFTKHVGFTLKALRRLLGDALFTAESDEPAWQLGHDILAPAFTREAMRGYHAAMVAVIRQMLEHWEMLADHGRQVDVTAEMTHLAFETIGRVGFGYQFASFDHDRPHPFVAAVKRTARHANLAGAIPWEPADRVLARLSYHYRSDMQMMEAVVDEIIQNRRRGARVSSPDLLALMLDTEHPVTGRRLDPVNIRRQIISFLMAGHETTASTLSFALYYLTRHPEILARARAELNALWGDADPFEPEFEDVVKLRYLRAVLDETLRLWPTAPGYQRAARADTLLGGRHAMHRGDWALVFLPVLHRDPQIWPDPERFDPDRFAPGLARSRPAHAYKPFGTGQRACIGRHFAMHEAVLTLALTLHRFDLVPDSNYRLTIAESLTLKPRGFTLVPSTRRA